VAVSPFERYLEAAVMDDSFADAPISIAEVKAERENRASMMPVRDCVVGFLRELDQKKIKPFMVAILFAEPMEDDPSVCKTNWRLASPNNLMTMGLMARSIHEMNVNASEE
jgi:hypothetical protein